MASFCFYRHTPQLSLILPSALPPQSPRLQLYGTVVNGWRAYRPSSLGQPCTICLSRERMDWTGVEQTEEGWISCVLHLSTQVFKRLPITALCIRLCVCVCVWKCVCMLCLYCIQEWERQKDEVRSEEKRGRERATAGIPSCPGWSHSHSGRPPAPRRVRPAHSPHG